MSLDFYLLSSITSLFQFGQYPRHRENSAHLVFDRNNSLHVILLASLTILTHSHSHKPLLILISPHLSFYFQTPWLYFILNFWKYKAQFKLREKAEVNLRITKLEGCIWRQICEVSFSLNLSSVLGTLFGYCCFQCLSCSSKHWSSRLLFSMM